MIHVPIAIMSVSSTSDLIDLRSVSASDNPSAEDIVQRPNDQPAAICRAVPCTCIDRNREDDPAAHETLVALSGFMRHLKTPAGFGAYHSTLYPSDAVQFWATTTQAPPFEQPARIRVLDMDPLNATQNIDLFRPISRLRAGERRHLNETPIILTLDPASFTRNADGGDSLYSSTFAAENLMIRTSLGYAKHNSYYDNGQGPICYPHAPSAAAAYYHGEVSSSAPPARPATTG